MRVFLNKWFCRWTKDERVPAATIWAVAEEVVAGNVEADLGGLLFKKRIPRQGEGKRSGYRVLVGFQKQGSNRVVFLYAFSKNQQANITTKERKALQLVAQAFLEATSEQLGQLLLKKEYMEIFENERDS
ncbi:type II toxin-antitoxin system RelE/ParE family toxin [Pelodictyon luteolum]|uniref:Type II toxin-antitoxin system RelE/ParE family toxin n=1 Tax=Chlorobium luteolum (strain DSM 273 / BCRC 81028 / 2530) TaxID=319225 RepID=Q3B4L4_CHLL3|nr:type II toxin-antitoxin system RelE/ParE family toxin [Pelodictyon luteolum]ABB23717.1 conserved hypothetical protein [Pelodictyon luteolum DSM 273]